MAQVKKLSVATVYGKIDLKELIEKESIPIMQIIGGAVSSKSGTSPYGEWTALLGQFEAKNLETGELFQSSQLFLPEVALTPILVGLSVEGVRGIEFAIEIQVKYSPDAKPGGSPYEYTWTPLLPADENDPITRVKNKMLALQAAAAKPALAAPATTAAPASAPAAAKKTGKR